jgi:hypothetical protein
MKVLGRDLAADARLLTSPIRVLPDFIIAGEAKCGTTSLYRYLQEHPDVFPADRKETRAFIDYPDSRLRCQSHFPSQFEKVYRQSFRGLRFVTGEATAEYFSRRKIPETIAKTLPNVKVIVLLRNPALRALSDFQMFKVHGLEKEDFNDVVGRSIRWLSNQEVFPWLLDAGQFEHSSIRYVVRGLYIEPVTRWQGFFTEKNLKFVVSERLFDSPRRVMDEIYQFLGLDTHDVAEFKVSRQGQYAPREYAASIRRLADFYRPFNAQLYEIFDEDFEWERQIDILSGATTKQRFGSSQTND